MSLELWIWSLGFGRPAKGGRSGRGAFQRYLEMGAGNSRDGISSRDLEAIYMMVKAEEADDFSEEENKEKQNALRPVPWKTR